MEIRLAGGSSRTPRARNGRTWHLERRSYRPPHAKPPRVCRCSLCVLSHRGRRGPTEYQIKDCRAEAASRAFTARSLHRRCEYLQPGGCDRLLNSPRKKRFVAGDMREDKGVQPWANLLSDDYAVLPVTTDIHSSAELLATSGSTGVPNCVIHTHATLAALFGLPFMCGGQ